MSVFGLEPSWILVVAAAMGGYVVGRATAGTPEERNARRRVRDQAAAQSLERLSEDTKIHMRELIRRGQIIEAVRVAREDLGIGLRDAKDLVDRLQAETPSR